MAVEPSGIYENCVSDYYVYDMSGNLPEWVIEESSGRFVLMGGGFSSTDKSKCSEHTPVSGDYGVSETGFRCCM